MDKNAIKKYAVWARRELISRVSQRAALYEITDKGYGDASTDSVLGRVMSAEEKRQRQALIAQIREKGYEQVMEEIAYTWFNRFIALRFMEVNGYIPSRVRVFTDEENSFKPQILTEAINIELDGLDMEKVYALKNANDDDALFKYMIIVQCNALSCILPGMFQRISDYTELLFPDNLLREGSVIEQMVAMIPEEDWTDQVQIIGWLYQYYNTEPKDKVFADLKKNIKISKENIPAATQLFTPDWIVRYMVENSLGRLWLEGHPNDELKASWKYYLTEVEQEQDVQAQLAENRKEFAALKPEDILAIDPCQGSGHILAYMFDVLVQIYEAYGYTAREAAASIVEHNIWGLDIDDRATQLAYFSVMMKARQYDRRFFSRNIQPHVYAVSESNGIDPHCIEYFTNGRQNLKSAINLLVSELHDAREYGSIIDVTPVDFDAIYTRFAEIKGEVTPGIYSYQAIELLLPFVQVAQTLAQKYHVVVTNPPYMGLSNGSGKLNDYAKKFYPSSKADLYAVFIERCQQLTRQGCYSALITQHSWMFLSVYENLRKKILGSSSVINMAHLGTRAFEEIGGEVVQTTTFVTRKGAVPGYIACFCRLVDESSQDAKEKAFLNREHICSKQQEAFLKLPGVPFAYWVTDAFVRMFEAPLFFDYSISDGQNKTGNNAKYLREFWEVSNDSVGIGKKWLFYAKGGGFRKWYGNLTETINWSDEARDFYRRDKICRIIPEYLWYKIGITWSLISNNPSFRILPEAATFDVGGSSIFLKDDEDLYFYLGLLNSKVFLQVQQVMNPTINIQVKDIRIMPVKKERQKSIEEHVNTAVTCCKEDWDSFETSWDFEAHPLVLLSRSSTHNKDISADSSTSTTLSIEHCFRLWQEICNNRFSKLKETEEVLNQIFIEIYGLSGELDPSVDEENITVRKADYSREIRSFISYAIGCMFGRYSLDTPGIVFAGGDWDPSKYSSFQPDKDAIIPICDDEYFEDDMVNRFVKFVEVVYGEENLEENLRFIANALGGKGSSREIIRNYFINDFYADHLKIYQRCPIYWLFDSGKKNGFKCLIYMHRYQPDTIARIRTDYVHEQQSRYRTAISDLESRISNTGTSERVKLSKQLATLQGQAEEIRIYEEKIHHLADQMISIDLDDGVKHNYAIFQDVLARLK